MVPRWISWLEHIGKTGVEKVVPLASTISALVNSFYPGLGTVVGLVIKAVGKAEADGIAAGQTGTGPQKMAAVVAAVSTDVNQTLIQLGKPSGPEAVKAVVQSVVTAMKTSPAPVPSAN